VKASNLAEMLDQIEIPLLSSRPMKRKEIMRKKRVKVSEAPPGFSLENTIGELVTLIDFRGKKNIYLVFNRGFF